MKPTPRFLKLLLALFAGITLCAAGSKAPAQIGDDVLRFEGHTYLVTTVAFSPDGKRLLVQSADGVTIHDATSGKRLARMEGVRSAHGRSVFSPDGNLVAGVVDFQLNVWDSETGKRVFQSPSREIAGNDEKVIAFAPDGQLVATPELILTVNDGVRVARFTDSEGRPLRLESRVIFTPDGQSLVGITSVRGDKSVVTSRLPEGLADAKAPVQVVFDTDNSLGKADDIALSVDGQILARLKGRAVALRMLAGGTQPDITCEEPVVRPVGVTFDPRGRHVAIAGERSVQIFDVGTGKTAAAFNIGEGKGINSLAFSPDGNRMALGMWEEPSVLVWDVAAGVKARIAAAEAAAKAEADRLAEIERKTAEIRAKRAEEKRLAEIEAVALRERMKKEAAEREAKEAEARRLAEIDAAARREQMRKETAEREARAAEREAKESEARRQVEIKAAAQREQFRKLAEKWRAKEAEAARVAEANASADAQRPVVASLLETVLGAESVEFGGTTFRGYTLGDKFDPEGVIQLPHPFDNGRFVFTVKAKGEEGRRKALHTAVVVDAGSQRIVGISASFGGDRKEILEDVIRLFGKTPNPIESHSVDGGAGKEGITIFKWTFPKSIARVVVTDFTPVRVCVFDREYVEAALGSYAHAVMTAADWLKQVTEEAAGSPDVARVVDKDQIARQVSELQERYRESQRTLTLQQQYEVAYLFGLDREAAAEKTLASPDTPDEERAKAKTYLEGRRAVNGAERDKNNAGVTDPSEVSSAASAHYALQKQVEDLRASRDSIENTAGIVWGAGWPALANARRELVLHEGIALYADQQAREYALQQRVERSSAPVPVCHVAAVWTEAGNLLAMVDLHASAKIGLQKLRVSSPEVRDWAGNSPTIASTECRDLFATLGSIVFQACFPPAGDTITVVSYVPRHSFAGTKVSPDSWNDDGSIIEPRPILSDLQHRISGRRDEWQCADGTTVACGAAGTFAVIKSVRKPPPPPRGL